ncbi:hypothetical protein GGS23DRAFT_536542 [Durotheca rogersii]|uniref:uncharacterized protein n=1 Tax=Durotheca rogersii TaxID=419775 RepID=UPI00221EDE08|nr:uncharacterized protein GGS23DRAFT_536542 [Durotheca rogersii]KAI5863495.1 hypothetical protein GGS23DRAFT_536542 [Durotheca rogersii]
MSGHHTASPFGPDSPPSPSRAPTAAGSQSPGAGSGGVPAAATAAGVSAVDGFTAKMRDRQARGKDPYESSDGGSDWIGERNRYRIGGNGEEESFASIERRRVAAQVLDSPELLMMAAQRDNESIPATRLRYTRMLCGFEEPSAPAPGRRNPHRSGSGSAGGSGGGGSSSAGTGAGASSSRAPGGSGGAGRSSRKDAR